MKLREKDEKYNANETRRKCLQDFARQPLGMDST
jgi:hypothetical protein